MLMPEQYATLKANILATPELADQPMNADGHFAIRAYYTQVASPDYFVFRTTVPVTEIMRNGFDWTRIDNLTVGKARIWEFMTIAGSIDPSQANVRAGILATFGTAGDLAMRTAIFAHCQRKANRGEKLLATGAGTTISEQGIGPASMTFEGTFSLQDIEIARNLP